MLRWGSSEAGAGGAGIIVQGDGHGPELSAMLGAGLSPELARHFDATLPTRPYCADDLRAGVVIRPRDEALRARYLQWNQRHRAATVLFDVDTAEAGAAWIDAGLPPPNLIVINPKNGHAKLAYALAVPVTTSHKGRKAPREMLDRLRLNMTAALRADPYFSGGAAITNNPIHPAWAMYSPTSHLYSLGELLETVPGPATRPEKGELIGEGRNRTIFDELSRWAYPLARAARESGDRARWDRAVREQAQRLNARFINPLRPREVDGIAKSVGKFAWENARKFKASQIGGVKRALVESKDREPMTPEEARQRMSEGRAYSAQVQRNATADRIIHAIGQLAQAGNLNPSKAQIARAAGVSERTVANYRARLNADGGGN